MKDQATPSGLPVAPLPAEGPTSVQGIATAEAAPPRAGAIGEIRIPKLGLVSPIVEVSWRIGEIEGQPVAEWETLPDAAGYHLGSAPLGGPGNCVISGHSRVNAANGVTGVFRRLQELVPGDRVELVDASAAGHQYIVQRTETVQELGASLEQRLRHASAMNPTDDDRLTLITCWPDWGYTHRVIVVAARQ